MATKNDLLAAFAAGFYPDCPSATAEELFDAAARTVLKGLRVRNATIEIPLVAGQREYALPTTVLGIREAYYEESADAQSWSVLEPTSLDALARGSEGWRAGGGTGVPARYYLGSEAVGTSAELRLAVDPIPAESAAGDFPRIRLYVTAYAPLAGGDPVFDGLLSHDAFLFHMARAWARRRDPERAEYWDALYNRTLAEESAHLRGLVEGAPPYRIFSPFHGRVTGQV